MKPLPPFGRRLVVSGCFPHILVMVGEPDCWQHARQQIDQGMTNILCLPDPATVDHYRWPVKNITLIVILFLFDINAECEAFLIATLCHEQPKQVIVRHWPGTDLIVRTPV